MGPVLVKPAMAMATRYDQPNLMSPMSEPCEPHQREDSRSRFAVQLGLSYTTCSASVPNWTRNLSKPDSPTDKRN